MALPTRFHVDDRRYVMCRAHHGCPMIENKPPAADTCWDHAQLPGMFRLGKDFDSTDPKIRERARRKAVTAYYAFMGVPGYVVEVVNA